MNLRNIKEMLFFLNISSYLKKIIQYGSNLKVNFMNQLLNIEEKNG
jgi:hypothetical protein